MRHGSAILHGPDTGNFAAPFAALDQAGGAVSVTPETLRDGLQQLDANRQDQLATIARTTLRASGDVSTVLSLILAVSGL
jgi:3-deoxy-D-manno-octulosonic-acid transferase